MELTDFQFKVLDEAANEESVVFAVANAAPNSSALAISRSKKQMDEVEQLVEEGLVKEITNFGKKGRDCRVFALTALGLLMFQRRQGRVQ